MPLLFLHGVNVRNEKANTNDGLVLADGLARHVLGPLAKDNVGRLSQISVSPAPRMFVPFWGDVGVKFRWNLKSLPTVRLSNALGGEGVAAGDPLPGQGEALAALLESAEIPVSSPNPMLQAAKRDLRAFLAVIFAPSVHKGEPLLEDEAAELSKKPTPDEAAKDVGTQGEALLADVLGELATDPAVIAAVNAAPDDTELLKKLQALVLERLQQRVKERQAAAPEKDGGQAFGPDDSSWGAWFSNAKDRVGEFFGRVRNAPTRAATVAGLTYARESLNDSATKFAGDVFEYLNHRGNKDNPGPIVKRVLDEIDAAKANGLNEPWFVVTHSMGGNIFYDILTHYRPDLDVEVWLSVGGQVGLFEEMKLFHASNPALKTGSFVQLPGPNVRRWLNIYDPADPFAYLAKPVFGPRVDADIAYSTGAGGTSSHSSYFKQRSFFNAVLTGLRQAYVNP